MSTTHDEWIAAVIRDRFDGKAYRTLGRCRPLVDEMADTFDDLRIVKGHVHCPDPWGKRAHWWLVDADGAIVDPTAGQFPHIYRYEEYEEGDEVRIGKCTDCGADLWGPPDRMGKTFCDDECERRYVNWINAGSPL